MLSELSVSKINPLQAKQRLLEGVISQDGKSDDLPCAKGVQRNAPPPLASMIMAAESGIDSAKELSQVT